jgi:hypothetical protein
MAVPLTQRIAHLIKRAESARSGSPGLEPSEVVGTQG